MSIKASKYYGMDIYTDGGKFLGRVQDLVIDMENGEVVRLTMEPLTFHSNLAGLDGDTVFDLDGWDYRENALRPLTAAYSSSQGHWVAGLLGKVPLIDTGRIGMKIAEITEGIFKSSDKAKEVTF